MNAVSHFIALAMVLFTAQAFAGMVSQAVPLKTAAGSKAESHVAIGNAHYGVGRWDDAKGHFMEAEKADPQSAETHYELASTPDKMGDHAGATEHFKRALALDENNAEIQHSEILAKHLKMQGRLSERPA